MPTKTNDTPIARDNHSMSVIFAHIPRSRRSLSHFFPKRLSGAGTRCLVKRPNVPLRHPSKRSSSGSQATSQTTSPLSPGGSCDAATGVRRAGGLRARRFYWRVDEKEGVDESQATRHARAVALVLQEAVTTSEMDDVRHQLKDEYTELSGRQGE
jgi:hypothetical protein